MSAPSGHSIRRTLVAVLSVGLLAVVGPAGVAQPAAADAEITETFTYTGDVQTFTVPAGVSEVDVIACGAQGENIDPLDQGGGFGGEARATIATSPGEDLIVVVGGAGASGGFNGGGERQGFVGTRGGGASDVRQGGVTLAERVVIGGGGGGAGLSGAFDGSRLDPGNVLVGGPGGGLAGGSAAGNWAADGGTATGGGQGGQVEPSPPYLTGASGQDGVLGQGGPGATGAVWGTGGGGGGLYGGGGGATVFVFTNFPYYGEFYDGGGGGGSGLGDSFAPGTCVGNGVVTISYTPAPTPVVVPGAVTISEGDTGTAVAEVPVSLSAPSTEEVTVEWATLDFTAIAPDDYQTATGGSVTFAQGQTEAIVPVTINADRLHEADEIALVSFTDPTNAVIGGFYGLGFAIITDDDPEPTAIPGLGLVQEGDTGPALLEVPITLTAPSGLPVTIDWRTLDLTASAPTDYLSASGAVTIEPGATRATATVTVNGDHDREHLESLLVSFRTPTGARLGGFYGLGLGLILNDD